MKDKYHSPKSPIITEGAKATIQRILKSHPVQPHKIQYYIERRDKDFDRKMQEVRVVYREVNVINDSNKKNNKIIIVSLDENPVYRQSGIPPPTYLQYPENTCR